MFGCSYAKGKMRASDAKAHGSDPYGYVTNRVITYMDYPDRVMRPKIQANWKETKKNGAKSKNQKPRYR